MAYISGSAALGAPFIINGEMLGGLVTDSNDAYSGLPVSGTNFTGDNAVALDTQAVLRAGFPTGSIIGALNYAASAGDYTGGDGIDITGQAVSVDLADSDSGLAFSGGKLLVQFGALSDAAVDVANDQIAFVDAGDSLTKRDSIADLATAMAGTGVAASSGVLSLDLSELSAAAVAVGADSIAFVDADDNGSKKESIADLATAMAGTGVAASSGVLSLDLNELSAADVDVAADSIAIIDATDNSSKKESIADLATAMAGTGITATNGVFSIGSEVATFDADKLRVVGTAVDGTDPTTFKLNVVGGILKVESV